MSEQRQLTNKMIYLEQLSVTTAVTHSRDTIGLAVLCHHLPKVLLSVSCNIDINTNLTRPASLV